MAASSTRLLALSLYRRLLRSARNWPGSEEEKVYILEESRTLFRKYLNLKDTASIKQKIFEGETRLEIGWHYLIPYPRPINLPPGAVAGQLLPDSPEVPTLEMGSLDSEEDEEGSLTSKH